MLCLVLLRFYCYVHGLGGADTLRKCAYRRLHRRHLVRAYAPVAVHRNSADCVMLVLVSMLESAVCGHTTGPVPWVEKAGTVRCKPSHDAQGMQVVLS
jgi:hypothetical protein